jgi:putative nucleotidyltransferase with HDIG domain
MNRQEALALLESNLHSENLRKHCLATEAIMRSLARHFGENEEIWGVAGLLHDLDLELVGNDMSTHGRVTAEMLANRGYPEEVCETIRMHNTEGLGLGRRSTRFQHALAASETITGLIVAATLVLPSKKLADLKPKSIRNRMKEKAFARGARREVILECEEAGIPLDDFIALSLKAMQGISDQLGL